MKKVLTIFITGVMMFTIAACGSREDISMEMEQVFESEESYSEFSWPDSEIAKLLPVPKSTIGRIEWEAAYGFVIYVAETPKSEYDTYVDSCKENGFNIDYRAGDDYYYADNEEGYRLSLKYQGDDIMFIRIDEPDEKTMTDGSDEIVIEESAKTQEEISEAVTTSETTESETVDTSADTINDGIRPEFKEAMDSYEVFFDEYCEFMKNYKSSDNPASMLGDYTDYMAKYTDAMTKMSELDDGTLSKEEVAYYAEVTTRITKKLAEAAQ